MSAKTKGTSKDSKEYWGYVSHVTAEVQKWPSWKTVGISAAQSGEGSVKGALVHGAKRPKHTK